MSGHVEDCRGMSGHGCECGDGGGYGGIGDKASNCAGLEWGTRLAPCVALNCISVADEWMLTCAWRMESSSATEAPAGLFRAIRTSKEGVRRRKSEKRFDGFAEVSLSAIVPSPRKSSEHWLFRGGHFA